MMEGKKDDQTSGGDLGDTGGVGGGGASGGGSAGGSSGGSSGGAGPGAGPGSEGAGSSAPDTTTDRDISPPSDHQISPSPSPARSESALGAVTHEAPAPSPANIGSGSSYSGSQSALSAVSRGPGVLGGTQPGASADAMERTSTSLGLSMADRYGTDPVSAVEGMNKMARTMAGETAGLPDWEEAAAARTMFNRMDAAAQGVGVSNPEFSTNPNQMLTAYDAAGLDPSRGLTTPSRAYTAAAPGTPQFASALHAIAQGMSPYGMPGAPPELTEATHYFNPDLASPKWGRGFPRFGSHAFGNPSSAPTPQQIADARAAVLGAPQPDLSAFGDFRTPHASMPAAPVAAPIPTGIRPSYPLSGGAFESGYGFGSPATPQGYGYATDAYGNSLVNQPTETSQLNSLAGAYLDSYYGDQVPQETIENLPDFQDAGRINPSSFAQFSALAEAIGIPGLTASAKFKGYPGRGFVEPDYPLSVPAFAGAGIPQGASAFGEFKGYPGRGFTTPDYQAPVSEVAGFAGAGIPQGASALGEFQGYPGRGFAEPDYQAPLAGFASPGISPGGAAPGTFVGVSGTGALGVTPGGMAPGMLDEVEIAQENLPDFGDYGRIRTGVTGTGAPGMTPAGVAQGMLGFDPNPPSPTAVLKGHVNPDGTMGQHWEEPGEIAAAPGYQNPARVYPGRPGQVDVPEFATVEVPEFGFPGSPPAVAPSQPSQPPAPPVAGSPPAVAGQPTVAGLWDQAKKIYQEQVAPNAKFAWDNLNNPLIGMLASLGPAYKSTDTNRGFKGDGRPADSQAQASSGADLSDADIEEIKRLLGGDEATEAPPPEDFIEELREAGVSDDMIAALLEGRLKPVNNKKIIEAFATA